MRGISLAAGESSSGRRPVPGRRRTRMGLPRVSWASRTSRTTRAGRRDDRVITCGMREYSYQATEASVDALRRLMRPWVSMAATERRVAVTTAEGVAVLISVEHADVEGVLEVSRLRADVITADDAAIADARDVAVGDLGQGRNDVVLFTAESWVEETPASGDGSAGAQVMQLTGRAGRRPDAATVVCTTTDSIVIAAATGEGVLIRIGVKPSTLDIVHDRVAIARFLLQRGYTDPDDPR